MEPSGEMEVESTKKRSAEEGAETESNDGSRRSSSPEPARKKKKIDPAQQMQTLFDFMRRYRREDGSELCETFIRAPKRRTEPGYYEVVTDPIDMLRIQQKLKTDEYSNMAELKEDFGKLLKNATSYYKKGSQEYKDAIELQDLLEKALAKVEAGEDPSATLGSREESDDNDIADMLEDLFASVMTVMDTADPERPLHLMFRLLPSQKRYPEYYKLITEPIDLKIIAGKIVDNKYEDLNALEVDIGQMCKNAQMFNEPGSQIYKDARIIMKTVKQKKFELEAAKTARDNRGTSRSRSRVPVKKRYASEIANMQYEDSESEESSEGEEGIDKEDPLWSLFSYIRYYKTNSGNALAEPFLTLPSKRELPDYYLTISNPISLNNIRKKLKNNEYAESANLYEDLNLMFENCKTYNRPDSRLYKDACKMQRLLKNKYEDLESESEEDSSEDEDKEDNNEDPKRVLYQTLIKYENSAGVQIIGMFMQKPSKKDYPDYYEVITNPMDMNTINDKIKKNQYKSTEEFIQDCRLMFNNCRQYNEEGSDIVKDANTLERRLYLKAKELGITTAVGRPRGSGVAGKGGAPVNKKAMAEKVKKLVDTIKDFRDPKGRQLALIFLMLPNIKEFPDYYQVIKNPIDLNKIGSKVRSNAYATLEECQSDLMLMFDNACKYNEPDSQIYKDALSLQNVVVRTAKTLAEEDMDESAVPNVIEAVQEILTHIFSQMYNQQDSDERCYSDSLAELPEHNEENGRKVRALNLDLIKRRLNRGLYKRLDDFQRDIFVVLERARTLSRTDSQVFEDSVELQTHFIRIRDEACGHGEILQSRALLYTQSDLLKSVEELKTVKQESEQPEDEETKENIDGKSSHTFNQQQYHVGDFVFVEISKEKGALPSIFLIENIFADKSTGEQMIYGNQFFRPIDTFHVNTRKFLEQEVFRSSEYKNLAFKDIVGRCFVMNVKDYFTKKPEGFEDKDIFVCESRYSSKTRSFKKMKLFWTVPDHIILVKRESVLEPKRVMSVFKERIEKHKEELEELAMMETTLETEIPPNIIWENPETVTGHGDGCVYYEQYTIPGPITLRRGDAVFVRAETGKNLIAQIDAMWTATDGMAYFHGPWFVTPKETPHPPTQMFYPREAFISTIQDTNPLLSVVGRCCILEMEDYVKSRPTQYDEEDVYICENVYDESRRVIRNLPPTGLKRYEYNSTQVMADEVYYFKKAIKPQKETAAVSMPVNSAPAAAPVSMMDVDNEDSMDAPSVGSTDSPVASTPARKVKRGGNKNVTPYIIYASEIRKSVTDQNKTCSFGEISKIVGDKWRSLSDTEKQHYEEKAKKMNEENALKAAEEKKLEEQRRLLEQQNAARAGQMQSVNSLGSALMSGGNVMSTPQGQPRGLSSMSPAPNQLSARTPSQNAAPMKQVEPIFHTVPPRPQRLLHSEAYIRYIEALTTDSNQMSNWEKQLKANREIVKCPDEARLPAHWLANNGDHNTSLDALWALRDFLTCDSLGVTRIVQGPL